MKKITFFTIIALIVSFLGSCKKEEINPYAGRVVAEGYIRQLGLKKGIVPNARVILYEVKTSGEPFAPINFIPIDTAVTNADGYYYIDKVVEDKQVSFHLDASAKNYSEESKSLGNPDVNFLDPNVLGVGKNHKARHDIGLRPYSWVKVHVTNIAPADNDDSILIGIYNTNGSDEFYQGANVNETFVRKIIGNDSTQISYRLQNGIANYTYKESPKKFVATPAGA